MISQPRCLCSSDTFMHTWNPASLYLSVLCLIIFALFFFFSSRRRHTRCGRDWSSDVCSSDLEPRPRRVDVPVAIPATHPGVEPMWLHQIQLIARAGHRDVEQPPLFFDLLFAPRSEERRVGKECRSRWSPYH